MDQHLRAALVECDAELASLAAATQVLTTRRAFILRALEPASLPLDAATPAPTAGAADTAPAVASRRRDGDVMRGVAHERSLLRVLAAATGPLSWRDIQAAGAPSGGNAQDALQRMVREGRVVAIGATRNRRYQLPDSGRSAGASAPAPAASEGDSPAETFTVVDVATTPVPAEEAFEQVLQEIEANTELEPDDDEDDDLEEQEPVETFRRTPAAQTFDPRFRQLDEVHPKKPRKRGAAPSSPSWWTGLTREEFAHLSDYEAQRLRGSNVVVPGANRIVGLL